MIYYHTGPLQLSHLLNNVGKGYLLTLRLHYQNKLTTGNKLP